MPHSSDLLHRLMALTRHDNHIVGMGPEDGIADRHGAIELNLYRGGIAHAGNALEQRIRDGHRIFTARVVAGHHNHIRMARHGCAHKHPFARITIAARPKKTP